MVYRSSKPSLMSKVSAEAGASALALRSISSDSRLCVIIPMPPWMSFSRSSSFGETWASGPGPKSLSGRFPSWRNC